MHIFPTTTYSAHIRGDGPSAWANLRACTELRDSLVTIRTAKLFIGQVGQGLFKLISSRIGVGAFCTMEGDFTTPSGSGTIRFRVHLAFRVLIGCWALAIGGLIGFMVWRRGFSTGGILALQIVEVIVFGAILRFVIIGGLFRSLVKSNMEALAPLLSLVDVHESE